VRCSAAILNGGQATRYGGRDKGALVVDGRTILERQLEALAPVASEILLVGGGEPREGVRVIDDVVPGCGPLGGVHAALVEAAHPITLVIACDMPYVSAPLLACLAEMAGAADAVVPRTEDGYHPLCAAYTRACLERFAARLARGRYTMTDALADVKVRIVEAGDIERFGHRHRLLANVNTPAEHGGLAALRQHEA
jgi:molybdopterin-guanine dinucleotide biosynthesis protein A